VSASDSAAGPAGAPRGPVPPPPGLGRTGKRIAAGIVVLLAVALAAPFVVRLQGRARLLAVRERLASEGMGRSLADAVGADVTCDAAALAAYDAAVEGIHGRRRSIFQERLERPTESVVLARYATGEIDALPTWLREESAADQADLEALVEAFGKGPIVATSLGGWIASGRRGEPDHESRFSAFDPAVAIASAALVGAIAAPEPGRGLAVLEGLERAWRHPGNHIDAIHFAVFSRQRDRAHLLLQLLGRLPEAHAARWLAVERPHLEVGADGLRANRLGWIAIEVDRFYEGNSSTFFGPAPRGDSGYLKWRVSQAVDAFHNHVRGMHHAAEYSIEVAAAEQALRDGVAVPDGVTNMVDVRFALHAEATDRAVRILVRLLRAGDGRGALPADDAGARAMLGPHAAALDGGPRRLPLRYERLSGNRVLVRAHRGGALAPLPASVATAGVVEPWSEARDEDHAQDRVLLGGGRAGVVLPAGR
jgi:hypothetical protein